MKHPNFFIVGAPKCGTTAMHAYLGAHPKVFMSQPKELFYWGAEYTPMAVAKTLKEYLSLFRDAGETCQVVGESSTLYLYSIDAPRLIHTFNPAAKILIFIRNPIDLVVSWHNHVCTVFDENISDFEQAWRLRDQRAMSRGVLRRCRMPVLLDYGRIGRQCAAISKWLEFFPSNQVKIVLFEEFVASARTVYEDVLAFLDVPSDGRAVFPKFNESGVVRNAWLAYCVLRMHPSLNRFGARLKALMGVGSLGLRRYIVAPGTRPALANRLRNELMEEFASDVLELSRLAPAVHELWSDFKPNKASFGLDRKNDLQSS